MRINGHIQNASDINMRNHPHDSSVELEAVFTVFSKLLQCTLPLL